jgi:pimeloyl-ACP methyl ester carboxylesterase
VIPWLLEGLTDRFDMVFVDQRGAGGSGYLGCERDFTSEDWAACGAEHADKGLSDYLTVHAAHDIEAVRRRLGYDKVYLFGLSYGTRVALEFLRQHEESAAAVVLDGVVPPDVDFIAQMMQNTDRGVDRLVAECEASVSCRAVSPRLLADLQSWRERVRDNPRLIQVNGDTYGEDESLFRLALEKLLQRREWRYRVPRAIHQAVGGKFSLWNALLSEVTGLKITSPAGGFGPSYVAPGLYVTIFCAEFLPGSALDQLDRLRQEVRWGTSSDLEMIGVCDDWGVNAAPPSQRQAVRSAVPTLLLSGDLDLQTISEWGDRAAATLSRGTHLVVSHTAHETVKNPCVSQIIMQFLREGGAMERVDTSCLSTIQPDRW